MVVQKSLQFLVIPLVTFGSAWASPHEEKNKQVAVAPVPAVSLESLSKSAPFTRNTWSIKNLLAVFGNTATEVGAKPLLPEEFVALPRDEWKNALHPDTAILLVLKLSRAARQLRPEEAASSEWMMPTLARIEPVGLKMSSDGMEFGAAQRFGGPVHIKGPNSPALLFRRNLKWKDANEGLDKVHPLVSEDNVSKIWVRQYSNPNLVPKLSPELLLSSDQTTDAEIEGWILARIYIARALGSWDSAELRKSMLAKAKPLIPEWDAFLLARAGEASKKLM